MAKHNNRRVSDTIDEPATSLDDEIITPNQVGLLIGKSGQTVRNWIRDGLLTYVRFPGSPGSIGVRRSEALKLIHNSALATRADTHGN